MGTTGVSLAVGVCYAYSDQPVVLVSTICSAANGVFVAGAGNPTTMVPVIVQRPNCLNNLSSALHPGLGVSDGSFTAPATACIN